MKQKMRLKTLGTPEHNHPEEWDVACHDEFLPEFKQFSEIARRHTYALIELLAKSGPRLGRPHVDTLKGSRHPNMKELRFRTDDGAWRIAFAFDVNAERFSWSAAINRESRRTSSIAA